MRGGGWRVIVVGFPRVSALSTFAHSTIPLSLSLPALVAARCSPLVRPDRPRPSPDLIHNRHSSRQGGSSFRTPHHHLTLKTQKKKEIVIQDGQPQDPEAVRMRDGGWFLLEARGEAREVKGRMSRRRGRDVGEEGMSGRIYEGDREEKRGDEGKMRRGETRRGKDKANQWI